jgi:glycosyltransferase involved in cell wall biosynthesis
MTGLRIRLDNIVRALTTAGQVDLFCIVSERPDLEGLSPSPPWNVERLLVCHRPRFGPRPRLMLAWLLSGWPRAVAWREWKEAADALSGWIRPPYDLVWFGGCPTWLALGPVVSAPTIVDLDNLEDEKLRTLREVYRLQHGEGWFSPSLRRRLQRMLGSALDLADLRRWRHVQRMAAETAQAVVVCSDLDRRRLGHAAAVVVPNGYALSSSPPRYTAPPEPVLTMVGLLTYPPNADGAMFFAHRVLPLVREKVAEARFRLVGRDDGLLGKLAELPGVDLIGEIDDLEETFRTTTAVVIPLRAGSGTRVKLLEAFARRVPVVSTTLGCEGVDARHGVELLIGDTPEALATACIDLITDPRKATAIADAGHALWQARFRWPDIQNQVRELAIALARA